ncbi:MAG TPA: hypothetical protein VFG62_22320, partial [Rhodopila sp.]|nr:hypothetical protein [Rhodopila sp.]
RNALLASAWAASVLLIVGTGTAAYTWRGDVDAMWPPAARILGTPSRATAGAGAPAPNAGARPYTSSVAGTLESARRD